MITIGCLVVMLWFLARDPATDTLVTFAWLLPALAYSATELYARGFSATVPHMQLWIEPDRGLAQVPSTPEARRGLRLAAMFNLLTVPLCFAAGFLGLLPPRWIVALALAPVCVLIAWALLRGRKGAGAGEAGRDYIPDLWPWSSLERYEVRVMPKDRCRLRARVRRYWGKIEVNRAWVVDIELADCPPAVAEQLRRLPFHRPAAPARQ